MSQIAFAFDSANTADHRSSGFEAAGFEIGWDHAHHRLTPPADHLHGTHPVRQGWEAGRAAFGARTLKPSRHVRQWLALRLAAWLRGQVFEDVRVTPRYLAQIDVMQCPVTRELLTHGADAPTDAVVVRAFEGAGFAAGNLVVMSRRAAQARGRCTAAQAEATAQRIAAGDLSSVGGLDAAQWQRLASLLRLVTPLAHAQVACLPLRVLPPARLHVLNPVQGLQSLLTVLFTGEAYARRMTSLGALMPNADARRQFFLFMNAMLARRLSAGWAADRQRVRTTLEDAWGHPVIQRRWEQLALRLSRADCERIVRIAAQRGIIGPSCQWLDDAAATDGWALETQGRVAPAAPCQTVVRVAADEPASGRHTGRRQPAPPATLPLVGASATR
jgi:hypothetical protein